MCPPLSVFVSTKKPSFNSRFLKGKLVFPKADLLAKQFCFGKFLLSQCHSGVSHQGASPKTLAPKLQYQDFRLRDFLAIIK